MEYGEKILTALVLPPGGLLLLAALGLLLAWRGWRSGPWLGGGALLALWLLATPAVSDLLRFSLERRFPPQDPARMPSADAIVLLGGGLMPSHRRNPFPDLGRAADRYWHAFRLWRAGRAPEILISGGALPWTDAAASEAEAALGLLVDLGIPAQRVLIEPASLNTRQNADLSAEILRGRGARRILLVTSALHMRRALRQFDNTGLEVIPAATDHEVGDEPPGLLRWLPDSEALDGSRRALKEYLGHALGK
ncbi:MAG: YdcF family protein [Gammaproteobacteria bacterium HGW-Gammaproteobacteria-8]|nr:MAG: YdcF family protein [Gammaproteobacteria bacterium HGW-Gammaproteobacteria-8]